jgi:hypothetical protein
MRLIVDSQRVSEHEVAAMVRGDGALEGVTAWASSERAAIQQAINVYFRVEEAKSAPTVTLTPSPTKGLVPARPITPTDLGRIVDRAVARVSSWPIEYQRVVDLERNHPSQRSTRPKD